MSIDKEKRRIIIEAINDVHEAVFQDEDGTERVLNLHPYFIGKVLLNLETARSLLGHTSINSTLRYIHGEAAKDPHFIFLKGIIQNEKMRRKQQ